MCTICILQALKYICQKDDQESQAYKKWEKNFLLSQTSKMTWVDKSFAMWLIFNYLELVGEWT